MCIYTNTTLTLHFTAKFHLVMNLIPPYRLCDERAAAGGHGPHSQTTNHNVFPVVAVAKVTKERSQ